MIHHGDLFNVLPTLPEASVDACVTDPPYGIGFMGREWDTFKPGVESERETENLEIESDNPNLKGRKRSPASSPSAVEYNRTVSGQREFQSWTERWAREVFRVLKPGAYLLVCGAPRSFHRMACGVEDAGFEVRDCLSWLYGQGFPKSLNISIAIDKNAGAMTARGKRITVAGRGMEKGREMPQHIGITDDAKQWAGWGTALKPGWEPIFVARKPFTGTVAANVIAFGTGALNIDACRVEGTTPLMRTLDQEYKPGFLRSQGRTPTGEMSDVGRWPANVLLDEEAAVMLDEQTGELISGANPTTRGSDKFRDAYGTFKGQTECDPARGLDVGGASRFYYVAKPSREERDYGTEGLIARQRDDSRKDGNPGGDNPRNRGLQPRGNFHPTVKPVELMRWLVKLVTPLGGTVLDPFTGSGTTGMACRYELREFVGVERESEYVQIAECRIAAVAPLFAENV